MEYCEEDVVLTLVKWSRITAIGVLVDRRTRTDKELGHTKNELFADTMIEIELTEEVQNDIGIEKTWVHIDDLMEYHANVLALDQYLVDQMDAGTMEFEYIKPLGGIGGGAPKKIRIKPTYPSSNHTYVKDWQGNDKLSGAQLAEKYILEQDDGCDFA